MPVDYTPPSPDEVRALLSALGLTGAQAAALMGLSDSRQVRKYTGGAEPRTMPFAALYALVHRASGREIAPDTWRAQLGIFLEVAMCDDELAKLRMSIARIAQALKLGEPLAQEGADLHRRVRAEPRGWNLLAAACVEEIERRLPGDDA